MYGVGCVCVCGGLVLFLKEGREVEEGLLSF